MITVPVVPLAGWSFGATQVAHSAPLASGVRVGAGFGSAMGFSMEIPARSATVRSRPKLELIATVPVTANRTIATEAITLRTQFDLQRLTMARQIAANARMTQIEVVVLRSTPKAFAHSQSRV